MIPSRSKTIRPTNPDAPVTTTRMRCPSLQYQGSSHTAEYLRVESCARVKVISVQEKTRHTIIDVIVKHYIHDEEPGSPRSAKVLG